MWISEFPYVLWLKWYNFMKIMKCAHLRWNWDCSYSLRITHNLEAICWCFCISKNASKSKSRVIGDDFVWFLNLRLSHRRVQAMTSRTGFLDFWHSRCRRVEKIKKIAFSLGRCCKNGKSRSHAGRESKKIMLPMQHGSAKIDLFNTSRTRTLVLRNVKNEFLWFLVILEGWKCV